MVCLYFRPTLLPHNEGWCGGFLENVLGLSSEQSGQIHNFRHVTSKKKCLLTPFEKYLRMFLNSMKFNGILDPRFWRSLFFTHIGYKSGHSAFRGWLSNHHHQQQNQQPQFNLQDTNTVSFFLFSESYEVKSVQM